MELREAWTNIVRADDYDRHMLRIGQAQATALLVRDLFVYLKPPPGSRVLIAGAGTGQMFRLFHGDVVFEGMHVICSDVNPEFLDVLKTRFPCETMVDDIEDTKVEPGVGAVILGLVLEHVDWEKALLSMLRLKPQRLLIVIQRNPEYMMSSGMMPCFPQGSMKVFSFEAFPHMVEEQQLLSALQELGYRMHSRKERLAGDGKVMVGLMCVPE